MLVIILALILLDTLFIMALASLGIIIEAIQMLLWTIPFVIIGIVLYVLRKKEIINGTQLKKILIGLCILIVIIIVGSIISKNVKKHNYIEAYKTCCIENGGTISDYKETKYNKLGVRCSLTDYVATSNKEKKKMYDNYIKCEYNAEVDIFGGHDKYKKAFGMEN